MPSLVGATVPNIEPAAAVAGKVEAGTAAVDSGATQSTENPVVFESKVRDLEIVEIQDDNNAKEEDPADIDNNRNNNAAAADSESTTPKSKKRKVTPAEDSDSKQTQQEKVKQMSLSSFFMPAKSDAAAGKSPMAANTTTAKKKNSKRKTPPPQQVSVVETLPSPRKRPLEDSMAIGKDETEEADKNPESEKKEREDEQPASADEELTSERKPAAEESAENIASKVTEKKDDIAAPSVIDLAGEEEDAKPTSGETEGTSADDTKPAAKPKATRKRAPKKAATTEKKALPARLEEKDLPEDRKSLHQQYKTMKARYMERSAQLVAQARSGIEEEKFEKQALEPLGQEESLDGEDFPTRVVGNMALIVEGSELPLSSLVNTVCTQLKEAHGKDWSTESVSAKIKILAQRKAYFDAATKSSSTVDLFEDSNEDRVWRWEITTLDLLPSDTLSKVRKARTARKKVASYHTAVGRLIKAIDDADSKIFDPKLPKLESVTAKVSRDEEKVLKFEREAEKQRLVDEAKAIKLQAKQKAKEHAAEKKRREKEEAAEKKRREKEEAALAKEEAKRKKEEEKEREEQAKKEKEQKKEESLAKQKNCLMSFFSAPKKPKAEVSKPVSVAVAGPTSNFDAEKFRSKINTSEKTPCFDFQSLSSVAKSSRKRRTKHVPVLVYTTVSQQESEWDAPAYAEEKTIMVPNRYRFLSFHEDCRPPYHGTWSKKSSIVTGKTPFGKESKVFDYDYDSEAEWEEGDDEVGEDVDDDEKNQEEDADETLALYDYDDGFCVSDDKMLDNEENADEETKAMYKKKIQNGETQQQLHTNRIQVIAPAFGGTPLQLSNIDSDRYEGYEKQDVGKVLRELEGNTLCNVRLSLDAFPQMHLSEEKQTTAASPSANADKDEYTKEAMTKLVRSVHHSTLNSKDKVVEELRSSYPTLFSNRAKATRKLDAIATKKKHPNETGGYYWEVKEETLKELELTDLIGKMMAGTEAKKPDAKLAANPGKKKTVPKKGTKTAKATTSTKKRKSPSATNQEKSGSPGKKNKSGENSDSKPKGAAKKASPVASTASKNLMMSFLKKS